MKTFIKIIKNRGYIHDACNILKLYIVKNSKTKNLKIYFDMKKRNTRNIIRKTFSLEPKAENEQGLSLV